MVAHAIPQQIKQESQHNFENVVTTKQLLTVQLNCSDKSDQTLLPGLDYVRPCINHPATTRWREKGGLIPDPHTAGNNKLFEAVFQPQMNSCYF